MSRTSLKPDSDIDPETSTGINPNDIQGSMSERFKSGAHDNIDLNNQENKASKSIRDNYDNTTADVKNREDSGNSVTPTEGKWANKTMPKTVSTKGDMVKLLLKRGGPTGGLFAIVLLLGGLLGGILTPASLFLNIKENLTLNWDQQNYTAEVRSRKILSKRLAEEATGSVCATTNMLCKKFRAPSQRMLRELDRVNIKAIQPDGSVLEKQRLILGERPAFYQMPDGSQISPKDFKSKLESDAVFRNTFRRAYNPRWANWFDDVSLKFLGRLGLTKAVSRTISEAADFDASRKAMQDTVDGKSNGLGESDVDIKNNVTETVDTESRKFSQLAGEKVAKTGNAAQMTAAVTCTAIQVPGLYSSIISNYRKLQAAAVVFPVILVVADAIKAGKASPNMTINSGTALTETSPTTGRSAMDSGAMMYGLTGDWASAANSKTAKKYIPGNFGGAASTIGAMAVAAQSPAIKAACTAATSAEADAAISAINAAKATNPVGWTMLAIDLALLAAEKTGVLDKIITEIITAGLAALNNIIDWNSILAILAGDFMKDARYEEYGDMAGVTIATMMADLSNTGGNMFLSVDQKLAFDQEIVNPVKLAWAKEDRLNHSPFDASNPNTFMGSIATKIIPYYTSSNSAASTLASTLKLVGSIPSSILTPNANASDEQMKWSSCPAEGDFAIASSGVAAGPLCDVQTGILPEYANADPEEVVAFLQQKNEVDDNGEVVAGSELESWIQNCNSNTYYNITQCMVNTSSDQANTEDAKVAAFRSLYQIDKRIVESMDNDPKANVENSSLNSDNITSTDDGPCDPRTADLGIYNNAHENGLRKSIRLCAVPNLPAPAYASSAQYQQFKMPEVDKDGNFIEGTEKSVNVAIVNARASGPTYDMTKAAKDDGVNLSLGSYFAFRTYEHQTSLRQQWCHKDDCGGAARPGFSNHEMGLAIDFNLPGEAHSSTRRNSEQYKWLVRRAGEFGYDDTAMPKEDWHWAYIR